MYELGTVYGAVAEVDGRVVGSSFLDERSIVGGVGSVSVKPVIQGSAIGRQLMVAVMERAAEQGFPGVRLVGVEQYLSRDWR